ncbi:MAG: alpha-E domain-containing protein [Gammaproteobacteria bacterium]
MLSRVADSIYWVGRYLERAENVARIVDVNLNLMLDLADTAKEQWAPLVQTSGDAALFAERYETPTRDNVIWFLTFDPANPNSILSCVTAARDNARRVREIISSEMWEQVNTYYHAVRDAARDSEALSAHNEFYARVKRESHLFNGITDAIMSHGEAWHFLRVGSLLERADKTSRILDVKYYILLPDISEVGGAFDNIQWSALLKSASANEMYRKRYRQLTPAKIVRFLLLDQEFPRAVRHCVMQADGCLHVISGSPPGSFSNAAERALGRLAAELNYAHVDEIVAGGLHEYLDNLQVALNRASVAVFDSFFSQRPEPAFEGATGND